MVQDIINAVAIGNNQHIVEIGPGMGIMTEAMLPLAHYLDAVELDRDLVNKLNQSLPLGNFAIHSADALKFDFCSLVRQQEKLRIVGNLPYNISTPLIFHLLQQVTCIEDMHFMLQKEVVDRLAASPGTGSYGKLSVMVQYYCQVEKLFDVAPEAFSPVPKVESAVVRMSPYRQPPVIIHDRKVFEQIVAMAFAQRRKTLRNNLKSVIDAEQMQIHGIDAVRRAETLSLQEFATLSNIVSQRLP